MSRQSLGFYLDLIRIRLQILMEYRATFLLGAIMQALGYGAQALLLWIMVDHFHGIGEWQPFEVILFWGINLFAYAAAGIFCFNSFYRLGDLIRSGEFDNMLTKPVNPFLFVAVRQFNYGYFGHLTLSGLVIVISMIRLGIDFGPGNLVILLAMIGGGALIHAAVFIFTGVPAFWLIRNEAIARMILWDLGDFARYPLSIFQRPIQILFTVLLPYGFVSYYPAQLFLSKHDTLGFHPAIQYLSPLVGVVAVLLAYRFWCFGLDRYQSTGS